MKYNYNYQYKTEKISNKNKKNKEKTVLLFIKDRGKKLYRKYVKQKQKNAIV